MVNDSDRTNTEVAIVGGGPAGLMLAIELGCRGVDCVLLEEDVGGPDRPKANATSSRTMEHYRRRGFAHRVRALGLPPQYPQDVVYTTRIAGHELARFRIPSAAEAASRTDFGDYGAAAWPTPELPHRAQQMYIEPVLKEEAEKYPSVDIRFGVRATAVHDDGDGVRIEGTDDRGNVGSLLKARYVVGCDGPRSLVRQAMGVTYSGMGTERREFFGGQMVSIFFQAPRLVEQLGKPPAWQYWAVNPEQRGLLCAVNGDDKFVLLIQLADGQPADQLDVAGTLEKAIGLRFDHQILSLTPWNAGYALVADQFRKGNLFIAGDAAHLFTPTGGMGYNTSVDDVVNLGWKLHLVLRHGAPDALLDTYGAERGPIAHRNTAFARRMADSIGGMPVTEAVEAEGPAGEAARAALSERLGRHVEREFNIPGLQLGVRYAGSPIVAGDDAEPPADDPNRYEPSGYPGARAPHVETVQGPLFDRYGIGHTLLVLADGNADAWTSAATRLDVPLAVLAWPDKAARTLHGADLVLIRPDHHIAWRGSMAADPDAVLRLATGRATRTIAP